MGLTPPVGVVGQVRRRPLTPAGDCVIMVPVSPLTPIALVLQEK